MFAIVFLSSSVRAIFPLSAYNGVSDAPIDKDGDKKMMTQVYKAVETK